MPEIKSKSQTSKIPESGFGEAGFLELWDSGIFFQELNFSKTQSPDGVWHFFPEFSCRIFTIPCIMMLA
jgi:hypothetical protein